MTIKNKPFCTLVVAHLSSSEILNTKSTTNQIKQNTVAKDSTPTSSQTPDTRAVNHWLRGPCPGDATRMRLGSIPCWVETGILKKESTTAKEYCRIWHHDLSDSKRTLLRNPLQCLDDSSWRQPITLSDQLLAAGTAHSPRLILRRFWQVSENQDTWDVIILMNSDSTSSPQKWAGISPANRFLNPMWALIFLFPPTNRGFAKGVSRTVSPHFWKWNRRKWKKKSGKRKKKIGTRKKQQKNEKIMETGKKDKKKEENEK